MIKIQVLFSCLNFDACMTSPMRFSVFMLISSAIAIASDKTISFISGYPIGVDPDSCGLCYTDVGCPDHVRMLCDS